LSHPRKGDFPKIWKRHRISFNILNDGIQILDSCPIIHPGLGRKLGMDQFQDGKINTGLK
jgi:hypothetical protein